MKQTVLIYSNFVELRRKSNRLFIKTPKSEGSIPITNVDGVLIFGKAKLSSDAISLCINENIPILLFNRFGLIKAQISR